jgi:hypothetical protein
MLRTNLKHAQQSIVYVSMRAVNKADNKQATKYQNTLHVHVLATTDIHSIQFLQMLSISHFSVSSKLARLGESVG